MGALSDDVIDEYVCPYVCLLFVLFTMSDQWTVASRHAEFFSFGDRRFSHGDVWSS